jgi:hypothetical protein
MSDSSSGGDADRKSGSAAKQGSEKTGEKDREHTNMKPRRTSVIVLALAVALVFGGFADTAYASTGKQMQGSGTGSIRCPLAPALPATIQMNLFLNKGSVNGFLQIIGGMAFVSGNATAGQIHDSNTFSMSGIVSFTNCLGGTSPTTFTLNGNCGAMAPVDFKAADGTTAAFIANVACA